VLDLWLMVVDEAYVLEICMIAFPIPARFSSAGMPAVFGLLSSSLPTVCPAYGYDLYAQLLRAVLAQRRERSAAVPGGRGYPQLIGAFDEDMKGKPSFGRD